MKKIIASSAVCIMALGIGVSVSAAPVDQGTTDLKIGFENDSTNVPVQDGQLGLSRIPTAFDFGQSNRITDKPQVIKTNNSLSQAPQYLAVNDKRDKEHKTGTWKVSVSASPIVNMDQSVTENNTLTGTTLSFKTKAMQFAGQDGKGVASPYQLVDGLDFLTNSITNLKTDGSPSDVDVMSVGDASVAPANELGSQVTDVSLYIPANTGTPNALYSGTVNWTLDATPK